jgi:5-bromo-4-chloroindolyl phosphate hydrolysis protein
MKEMIKKYKGTLICSVLVMLAGILVGFTMAQSIWINVLFVVTDCMLVTIIFYDNRNRQQSSKVIGMVIWIIPVTTLIYNGMARLISMDSDSENLFMAVIYFGTGLLFMIIVDAYIMVIVVIAIAVDQYDRDPGYMDIAG